MKKEKCCSKILKSLGALAIVGAVVGLVKNKLGKKKEIKG